MEPENRIKTVIQSERADFKLRAPIIRGILQNHFSQTALVEEREFAHEDIQIIRQAYIAAAPFAFNKLFPNYWEHCLYSSILARHIAAIVGSDELKPLEAEVLAFIGDDGSIAVPHRYARKNISENIFDRDIGIRIDLLAKQPPVLKIIGLRVFHINNQTAHSVNDLTLPQVILDTADNLGKINPSGTPRTVQETIEANMRQPLAYAGGIFPSERAGLRALTEKGKQQFANQLLEQEIEKLKREFGVDINDQISLSYEEYLSAENQQWLLKAKQAQETLDPEVDRKLHRPPIHWIVFDAGGVLMKDADPALFRNLAAFFNQSYEDVISAMNTLNPLAFGNKISEEEYLKRFWGMMQRTFPGNIESARTPFIQPHIYQPMEGMQNLVKRLAQNSAVQLYVLSDCIHAVTPPVFNWILESYPQIPPGHILISSRINSAKRETDSPAFKILLERLGNPHPQSVLFADDNPNYTINARARYNIRSMHFRENDPERLEQELIAAGLITVID